MDTSPETHAEYVFDVTTDTFEKQVIERSHEVPIVVDFWAEWCGPCRMLGPVLERVVSAFAGRVLLAKVDTDAQPALAQRFRISGIPAVKVFHKGRVVNEFVGARDQRFVANFLDALVPSPAAQTLEGAAAALSAGQPDQVIALVEPLLADSERPLSGESRDRALMLLAAAKLRLGADEAVPALLDQLDPRGAELERAEVLRGMLEFFQTGGALLSPAAAEAQLAQDGDRQALSDAHYARAAGRSRAGEFEGACEDLLWLIENHRRYREDAGRKTLLLLFQYIGQVVGEHPAVHDARRRLQVLL
ncbi:MAG TPA: tetratricopeptide repeat protein [Pseudomonadota bacterium]|nr:tetratricopeptide repeat protein [Pseudomonadota bacterium]